MEERILKVYLQPRSSRNEIVGPFRDGIKVRVTAPPIENRANDALFQLLSEEFQISPSYIKIIRGYHSRKKTLRIISSNPLTLKRKSFSLNNGSG